MTFVPNPSMGLWLRLQTAEGKHIVAWNVGANESYLIGKGHLQKEEHFFFFFKGPFTSVILKTTINNPIVYRAGMWGTGPGLEGRCRTMKGGRHEGAESHRARMPCGPGRVRWCLFYTSDWGFSPGILSHRVGGISLFLIQRRKEGSGPVCDCSRSCEKQMWG